MLPGIAVGAPIFVGGQNTSSSRDPFHAADVTRSIAVCKRLLAAHVIAS